MFKLKIVKPKYKPKVGMFFTYGSQQFKVVRIHALSGNLYFAWWDGTAGKVVTNNLFENGLSEDAFAKAIYDGKYIPFDKTLAHPKEFREFTLFNYVSIQYQIKNQSRE